MATAVVQGGCVDFQSGWADLELPEAVREVLSAAPLLQAPETRAQLMDWALGRSSGDTDWTLGNRDDHGQYEAVFQAPGAGRIVEAVITKARNGLAINFPDPAMRRRDPDAMVIGDKLPTDGLFFFFKIFCSRLAQRIAGRGKLPAFLPRRRKMPRKNAP